MLPHNKIIKTTVKEFLEPENLFQIGSSRSWVDDNGYYFIIVEFATNGYSKGASLNAGVSFLWESTESLNKMLSYTMDVMLVPVLVMWNIKTMMRRFRLS